MNGTVRYVDHIDVLGMSDLVNRNFDGAWSMLSDLVSVKEKALSYAYEFVEEKQLVPIQDNIGSVVFSDTMLLYTNGVGRVELQSLLVLSSEVFHKALFRCVPVRVGIAVGEFRVDSARSMYAGPALIDAYRVGEESQWLGIALSDSLRDEALALKMKTRSSDVIVPWHVPIKGGVVARHVLNWPAAFAHDFKVKPPITVAQFYVAFEQSFGPFDSLPGNVQAKYRSTVEFINTQLAVHHAV